MWRSVGTVAPNDNKHNRSRDQGTYQPFAQASRLRLNESQLSGDKSPQFMTQYFNKKRTQEGTLHRVLSQKSIEEKHVTSPPASLRDVGSPKHRTKTQSNEVICSVQQGSLQQLQKSFKGGSIEKEQVVKKGQPQRCQVLRQELKAVREEQNRLRKLINNQVAVFKRELKAFEDQVGQRLSGAENDKNKKQSVNPQLLGKIRQEGARFNERMRELDVKKQQINAKYKAKHQNG